MHLLDDDPLFIYSLAEDFPKHLCDLKEKKYGDFGRRQTHDV